MILLLCVVILIAACAKSPSAGGSGRTMRCPTCGAQATVRGNSWECGWCGDSGVFR